MQVEITKKFSKQVSKCKDAKIQAKLHQTITEIMEASGLTRIKNIKKLKGHQSMYRIKIQDYRIG